MKVPPFLPTVIGPSLNSSVSANKLNLEHMSAVKPESSNPILGLKKEEGVKVDLYRTQAPSRIVVFEPPVELRTSVFENKDLLSETSSRLLNQLDRFGFSLKQENRINGVGDRFSELMKGDETSYHQDMRRYQYFVDKTRANQAVDFSDLSIKRESLVQDFSLNLTTSSGAKIEFNIQSFSGFGKKPDEIIFQSDQLTISKPGQGAHFNRTEIDFNIQGDLSKEEQKQIQEFAEKLETFASGYFNDGEPSLKDLDLTSFDTIESLSLRGSGGGQPDLKLNYRNDENTREIEFSFDGNRAEIKVDKTDQLSYSQKGKQQAIEHYLKLLEQSGEKAKSDEIQLRMMQEVLGTGFELTQKELNLASRAEQEFQEEVNQSRVDDGIRADQIFIPLADFEFNFSSRKDRVPNDLLSLQERGFDVKLSLDTRMNDEHGKISKQQIQSFELSGIYTDRLDTEDVRYQQTRFDIKSSTTISTSTESQDGKLLGAFIETEKSEKQIVENYDVDSLLSSETEQSESHSVSDLMKNPLLDKDAIHGRQLLTNEQLQQTNQMLQLRLLDEVLLDPFDSNRVLSTDKNTISV